MLRPFFLSIALLLTLGGSASAGAPAGWKLIFSDEFKGPGLNPDKWNRIDYASGAGADWHKKQSRDKALVTFSKADDGYVSLWGKKGRFSNCEQPKPAKDTYACGGIFTEKTFAFQYGYVEVRARMDGCNGAWPAIWLLPSGKSGLRGWPTGGEIDMLEHLSHETRIYQTLHMPADNGTGHRNAPGGTDTQDKEGWHVYGMEWGPGYIKLLFDDRVTGDFRKENYPSWPFDAKDNEFYLLLDQQLGGAWVGHNFEDSILKGKGAGLHIDYVRVYAHPEGSHTVVKQKKDDRVGKKKP